MEEATPNSSLRTILSDHELCTPTGAKKKWWGIIIALLKDHKALAAAGQADAYCKLCQKLLKYNKNTGNLDNHVQAVHAEALKEMLAGGVTKQKQQGQTQMDIYCEQVPHFELQLVRWLVQNYQSINVVEHPAFKAMIAAANSSVRIPNRRNITARLDELEESARNGIRKSMKGLFLAITADAWSSPVMDSFLSLTASALDETFTLVNLPLECSSFDGSHTAERIYEKLQQLLARNGINESYVSAIVADNAANQKKAGELAPYDSLGCAPHTLQLTVKMILEDPVCAALLKKCRKLVGSFRHSAAKVQELKGEQQRLELPERRVIQDVKTRWSSTYMSIDMLCDNQMAINVVCARHADPNASGGKKVRRAAAAVAASATTTAAAAAVAPAITAAAPLTAAAAAALGPAIARRVTRLFSGAVAQLPAGALADDDTDSSDSDDYYSSSDDGASDIDYETPRPPADKPVQSEVVDVVDESSSTEDSGNSGASDFEETINSRKRKSNGSSSKSGTRSKKTVKGNSTSNSSSKKAGSSKGASSSKSKAAASSKRPKASSKGDGDADVTRKASKSKRDRFMVALSPEEWALLKLVRDLLKPFYVAQTALEGEKFITRSWLPFYINNLIKHLQAFIDRDEGDISTAAAMLLLDLRERWGEWPRATRIAVALDPRTKYMGCFTEKRVRDAAWADVVDEMKALYFMQKAALKSASSSSSSPIKPTLALAVAAAAAAAEVSKFDGVDLANDPDAVDADDDDDFDDIITDGDARLVEQRAESEKTLFRGKNEPALLDPKGNPFEWWRERAAAYPLLSVVARKWLAVPASSAASERMFSSAGLTVSKKRTSLKKERVSTLVFLKTAWPALEAQGVLYGADSKCRKRTSKQT